jgi:trk system potassium uptake protein TrkA
MMTRVQRIVIGGAGNIGLRVARALESRYEVKLIENRQDRAEQAANSLKDALVLFGDSTDEDLLEQENIQDMDLFLALTNDDENNIMSASLAKRMGCKRVVAIVNRRAYAEMIQGGPIDIAISPAQVSIGSLLAHLRKGDVAFPAPRRCRSTGDCRPRRCQELPGSRPTHRRDRLPTRRDRGGPGPEFRSGGDAAGA